MNDILTMNVNELSLAKLREYLVDLIPLRNSSIILVLERMSRSAVVT